MSLGMDFGESKKPKKAACAEVAEIRGPSKLLFFICPLEAISATLYCRRGSLLGRATGPVRSKGREGSEQLKESIHGV